MLADTKPEEGEPEWMLSLAEANAAATAATLVTSAASQQGVAPVPVSGSPSASAAATPSAADEPNPDPPASFEVSEDPSNETRPYLSLSPPSFFSTLSIMILDTCAWLCLALVYLAHEH